MQLRLAGGEDDEDVGVVCEALDDEVEDAGFYAEGIELVGGVGVGVGTFCWDTRFPG